MITDKIVFKNSMFVLNDLDQFLLVGLGEANGEIKQKMSNKEIIDEYIVELEFITPDECDGYGVYRGDLILVFTKDWTDCGYEYDSYCELGETKFIKEI